jgi:hypothetical protein
MQDENQDGFGYDKSVYIDYIKFLAKTAADNNLAIGLKNAVDIIADVVDVVQFAVNEQVRGFCKGESMNGKANFVNSATNTMASVLYTSPSQTPTRQSSTSSMEAITATPQPASNSLLLSSPRTRD